ncbi:glutamate synthase-related protein [Desulfovibrio gilichinskyi]|uniref:glutamate synthase (NADPH) n=1 Tax=Desulfovibrio gilichinskyi TaxID=1519643 RepID=A0A1X7C7Y1_9BACT|nr:glutamate synthase-related protein [Desulfovibrio gilichinskyi]SME91704.1 4Fe-4S dicluster domain-containing protein [Desulfovibrio gilichinskyi]
MLFHKLTGAYPEFTISRDKDLCINCEICVRQCSYGVHFQDTARGIVRHENSKCVGCQRCVTFCPTGALLIKNANSFFPQIGLIHNHFKQVEPCYLDKLYLDSCAFDTVVNDSFSPVQHTSESPILFSSKTSVPINLNLLTAMKMVSEKLGLDFDVAGRMHTKSIPAAHNVADSAVNAVKNGAEVLIIEGFQPGAGPFASVIPNEGMPIEFAVAVVDQRLKDEGLRNKVSVIADGKIRCSADVVKLVALGANVVCLGNVAMVAVGCTCCGQCSTGKCAWGIATTATVLRKRQNPEVAAEKMADLISAWNCEITQMLNVMGITFIRDLCGNKDKIRAVGLSDTEMSILGVRHTGQ